MSLKKWDWLPKEGGKTRLIHTPWLYCLLCELYFKYASYLITSTSISNMFLTLVQRSTRYAAPATWYSDPSGRKRSCGANRPKTRGWQFELP
jgi:hypothetical protein